MATKTATKKVSKANGKKKKDVAANYNEFKNFEGQQYTGMKIGRSHKWYYDKGEWKETKMTPDLWEINYEVVKRRAGKAPEGSGVPEGTEYHWYILSHQYVKKLSANDYSTAMSGLKFKLAHKRFDKTKWSTSEATQRKRLVGILKQMIAQLEQDPVEIEFEYKGETYKGEGFPVTPVCKDDACMELDITLNGEHLGIIHCTDKGWKMKNVKDQKLVNAIGHEIFLWYE